MPLGYYLRSNRVVTNNHEAFSAYIDDNIFWPPCIDQLPLEVSA